MQITVVLDTNLFIAAYWKRGSASSKIIQACVDGRLKAFYTPEIERELWFVVRTIKVRDEFTAVVSNFLGRAEQISPLARVDIVSEDPDDQKFLVCAASADADYLITSDDHLLVFGQVGRTIITKPGDFWRKQHANIGIPEEG